ncbi:DNA polymerase III subunit gamma/tau [Marinomonas sp. TI.3.20]|uniref:DNA polymerase III subunit gamma/tau n=1 Tax=Marinomonas sp. TI.3.20 TaxID=3121296 RepID=UPI00311DC701
MSYQVLARKWRPQTFLEMAGQDHVLQALVNALRQQRLHHAYLFSGTRGVGKTTIARIFAKCLNCETNGISPEPCGHCDSCVEIAEGRFVDLIEVDAASRTKVEDTRELLENVQYAPTRGRFKVYLIDEVHMLSTHSFNALLKTLEEPPAHVKFLLATTDPQKLPVTILSRCLQFNLKNMTPQRVVDYLETVLTTEQVSYDQPALWQIGQAANGSMRDALSLTDQAIAFGNGTISETGVTAMLGLVNQAQILDLLDCVASKNAALVLQKIDALAGYQPDFVAICGSLLDTLHRVAVEQQVPGALLDQQGDLDRIQHIAATVSPEEIQLMYQSLLIGRRDLHLSHTVRSGFEMLMLRLIAFRPTPPMSVSYAEPPRTEAPINSSSIKPSGTLSAELEVTAAEPQDEMPTGYADEYSEEPKTTHLASNIADVVVADVVIDSVAVDDVSAGGVPAENVNAEDALIKHSESKHSEPLSDAERPPWEDAPATQNNTAVDVALEENVTESSFVENNPIEKSSTTPHKEADASVLMNDESAVEVPVNEKAIVEQSIAEKRMAEAVTKEESVVKDVPFVKEAPSTVAPATVEADDDEDEDEEEAEERAIADVSDPFNPAAELVQALGADTEVVAPDLVEEESNEPKAPDTVAQPALGMPLPEMHHFSELTMKLWWLVAPRLPLTGLVQNILMNSSLISATEQGIKLEVPLEYGHMLNQTRYEQIQGALSDFFEQSVPLIIDTVEDTSGVTAEEFAASKRADALQVAIEHLNSHPVVQALASTMGAQLVYDTVKAKV